MKNWKWFILALLAVLGLMWLISYGNISKAQAGDSKLNICHFNSGKNSWEGVEISSSAWDTHKTHGDFSYEGPLDKNGKPDNKDKAADAWCEEHAPKMSPTPTPSPSPSPSPTPKPPKDYCKNFEGKQSELPYGMVSEEGICSCAEGYHKVEPAEENGLLTLVRKEYDNFTCELDYPPAGECPTACGLPASEVDDGKGGKLQCNATPACEQPKQEESKPSGCTGDCSAPAPQCGSQNTTNQPLNFHVYRNGGDAILKWWATEGNKVNVYWKNPSNSNWEHAAQFENTGYVEIHNLGSYDWTFGIQQVNDCGGGLVTVGRIMEVVDGNVHGWVLFR